MIIIGMFVEWWLLRPSALSPSEKKLREVYRLVTDRYVDDVSVDSLIELTIPALLNSLDPHTVYIPVSERAEADSQIEGSFSGVGIEFRIENDEIVVAQIISGGPAEKVGIMAGDVIVTVDDENVSKIGINEQGVRERLRGEKGSTVRLEIRRQGLDKTIDFTVKRDDVPVTSIDASFILEPGVGYIKLNSFSANTYTEFLNAAMDLLSQGAEDFILDLRDNPGGLLNNSILIANEFLHRNMPIVSTRGRGGKVGDAPISDGTGLLRDNRVVVLVNELSASAAEVLTGALQDNDRALILGRRTFGKGLVQEPITLSDGSEVRLTIQRYYTPSGRSIQRSYKMGDKSGYEDEILQRYTSGELLKLDSTKINRDLLFHTAGGRPVYGGGGIIPDIFVPNDTSAITGYYVDVARRGLLEKFASEYVSLSRSQLMKAKNVLELLPMLPSDDILLASFADFARMNGVPPRWYYLNISSKLIVIQLKALIAYNVLGRDAYYMIYSRIDNNIDAALKALHSGKADFPIKQ